MEELIDLNNGVVKVFEHEGIKCLIRKVEGKGFNESDEIVPYFWYCGYCGIPKSHPLYGKEYSDTLPDVTYADMEDKPIGKRGIISIFFNSGKEAHDPIPIEFYFNVHGSITYADCKIYRFKGQPWNLWWFGFDCNHSGDNIEKCNLEYVEAECRSLAKQLLDYASQAKKRGGK